MQTMECYLAIKRERSSQATKRHGGTFGAHHWMQKAIWKESKLCASIICSRKGKVNEAMRGLFPMVQGAGVKDECVNNGDLSGSRMDIMVMDT